MGAKQDGQLFCETVRDRDIEPTSLNIAAPRVKLTFKTMAWRQKKDCRFAPRSLSLAFRIKETDRTGS
ncbi:hypothetical protein [Leptothoe sp. PORK10 BA2]|uniref:hypothetical protein n=1 Tax=Leptothoe sp. PORK10 BA2 TaxID=3110254 RepID=UPI002B22000C|nr:hypothetical protein [Leptothoe sp. PORK10 BA2]MEA5462218.1 hypothetical protein [Leptothoe sp. PORK10 BA2]